MMYIKPLRLPIGERIRSKKYMTEAQADRLFQNRLWVEEKMDGTHRVIELDNMLLFVEDMLYRKTVSYIVPARYCVFDIYDLKNRMILGRESKEKVFKTLLETYPILVSKLFLVRAIAYLEPGTDWKTIPNLARQRSLYVQEGLMEGVVVKLADDVRFDDIKKDDVISGKFINNEFYLNMKPNKISGKNRIDPSLFTTY